MLMYFIKANIVLTVLYGFYALICNGDTFFRWRRVSLLAIYALSLLLPVVQFVEAVQPARPVAAVLQNVAYVLPTVVVSPAPDTVNWLALAGWLYAVVALVLFLRMCWQVAMVCLLASRSERATLWGIEVCVLSSGYSPFSFFRWIFVNPEMRTPAQLRQILCHEQTHARQWHSADAMLAQLFAIAFWFNPVTWLMRAQVRNNSEYLADRSVIDGGADKKAYQYHLLAMAYQKNVATLTNNFNVLPLKKRMKMMNKRTSNPLARFKYLLFVPLAFALMAVNSAETRANVQSVVVKKKTPAKKTTPNNKVYEVVEQMPNFPGGDGALMKYLAENIKYPAAALKAQQQGRVVVGFIVEKNGTVSNVTVKRSVSPALDAEALRVIKAMPQWIPGKQNGQVVRVNYNVPVSFKLK